MFTGTQDSSAIGSVGVGGLILTRNLLVISAGYVGLFLFVCFKSVIDVFAVLCLKNLALAC